MPSRDSRPRRRARRRSPPTAARASRRPPPARPRAPGRAARPASPRLEERTLHLGHHRFAGEDVPLDGVALARCDGLPRSGTPRRCATPTRPSAATAPSWRVSRPSSSASSGAIASSGDEPFREQSEHASPVRPPPRPPVSRPRRRLPSPTARPSRQRSSFDWTAQPISPAVGVDRADREGPAFTSLCATASTLSTERRFAMLPSRAYTRAHALRYQRRNAWVTSDELATLTDDEIMTDAAPARRPSSLTRDGRPGRDADDQDTDADDTDHDADADDPSSDARSPARRTGRRRRSSSPSYWEQQPLARRAGRAGPLRRPPLRRATSSG